MLLLKKYSIIIVTMCHIRLMRPTALIKCLMAAMTLLSLSGCVYDYPPEECFMTASVEVRFDWSLADGSPLPDGMGVMMYPSQSRLLPFRHAS